MGPAFTHNPLGVKNLPMPTSAHDVWRAAQAAR